jgi:hypothetical protein
MFKDVSRTTVVAAWCAVVIVIAAGSVAAGAPVTTGNAELFLLTCLVPPAGILLAWRGAPPETVAELLYALDQPSKESRL